jgi:amidase
MASDRSASRSRGITRRAFLGTGIGGGAALIYGGFGSRLATASPAPPAPVGPWIEATIPQLQDMMSSGGLTSRELTLGYLKRIAALNPTIHAVIETNPNAVSIAAGLDNERRAGNVRGPLHGIPILLKDNIATDDNLQTTAGSLALVNSRVPGDAPIVARLRAAGGVVLGKANLSEWANFRGFAPFNGWSARGGFTRDAYLLSFDPCGSSSGSAVAPSVNLCAMAIGTETDGSIVCPSGNNLVFGLKPTIGLWSQDGIIPIGHSQDTAGPIGRSVTDVAILLGALQTPTAGVPSDYTPFLQRGALNGKRIGVDTRYFTPAYGGEDDLVAVANQGIAAMQSLGATIVDTDTGDPNVYFNDEFLVLLTEFKVQVADYMAALSHTSVRTLADLIAFNIANCEQEMRYFGQELFEASEATSGDLTDPSYLAARANCILLSRSQGIDGALQRDHLDAIVAPTYSFASSPAAVAGYPNISIPVGLTPEGKPAGLWMYASARQEAKLLAFAYDLEQAIQPRSSAQFLGSIPPEPPDAGICAALPPTHGHSGTPVLQQHLGTGKPLRR